MNIIKPPLLFNIVDVDKIPGSYSSYLIPEHSEPLVEDELVVFEVCHLHRNLEISVGFNCKISTSCVAATHDEAIRGYREGAGLHSEVDGVIYIDLDLGPFVLKVVVLQNRGLLRHRFSDHVDIVGLERSSHRPL